MGQGLSALVWGSVRARVEFHYNLLEYKKLLKELSLANSIYFLLLCYTPIIQYAYLVVLGSVVLGPFGSPVFRLAKVCTPERNLFQLAVELTLFDGQKEETRHFYSRIFLVVSSKRKILDLGVFKMKR